MKCPNKSHPDWKELVNLIGEDAAYAAWIKNGEEIPNPSTYNSVDIVNPEDITEGLFVLGFTPYLQNATVKHIFEFVIADIEENPGVTFNQAISNYVAYAEDRVAEGEDKFNAIIENIDQFRELVRDRLDRLQLLTKRESDPNEVIDTDESGDQQSDSFYWEDDWVFKFNSKGNALDQVKKFLVFIPKTTFTNGEYSENENYLGTIDHMDYDEVFEDLKALLADVPNTWTDMRAVLEEHQQGKPWIYSLLYQIDNHEGDKNRLINQFVSTFSSSASNFKTLLWEEDKGAFIAKLVDTDQNSAQKTLLSKWQDNFNQSRILTIDSEGNQVAVKEEVEDAINALNLLKTNRTGVSKFLSALGIEVSESTIAALLEGKVGGLSFDQHFTSNRGLFFNIKDRLLGKDAVDLEFSDVVNPVINNSGVRALARVEINNNPAIYSNSLINGEGNTVYSYSLNKFLTQRIQQLHDIDYVNQLAKVTFQKPIIDEDQPLYKSWIWQLQNNPLFLEHFDIGAFDTIRKQTTFDQGVRISNMTDVDLELTKTTAFQNKGKSIKGLGRLANYIFTIPSKTTSYTFTAPAIDISLGKDNKLGKSTINNLYTIALSELSRINSAKDREIINKKYKNGSKHFFFFPQLNDIKEIWNTNGTVKAPSTKVGETTVESIIKNHIEGVIKQDVESKIQYWKDNGFIEDGKLKYIDQKYKSKVLKNDTTNHYLAAFDYIINNMLFKFNLHQTFIGDPAVYFKENIEETWEDIGKRLAAMIAPGKDLALSSANEQFISIKAKDREGNIAINAAQLEERLGEAYKPYQKLNGTDAQEFVTLTEKVTVLYKAGLLPTNVYNNILSRIETERDKIILDYNELSLIFQPDKPVYVNNTIDSKEDVAMLNYVKSSSIPLIPQFTQGLQLDKVRKSMEKLEKVEKLPARLAFDSATKVGGIPSIDIFTDDGDIKDNLDFSKNFKYYNRSGFRIQQDVPYDEEHDLVIKSSQATKLLFDNALDVGGFKYKTEGDLKGSELITKWNDLHRRLFDWTKDELHKELLDPITKKLNVKKVQTLLLREAQKRSYSPADIASLTLLPDNVTFEYPFWAITGSKKYESILTSLYSNNVIKQKMHGHSYVLVSEEGTQGSSKGVIYTKSYDPTKGLQPMRIEYESTSIVNKEIAELFKESISKEKGDQQVKVYSTDPTNGVKTLEEQKASDAITEIEKQYKRLKNLIKCLNK